MNPQNPVVIVAARRTAMGGFMGGLSDVDATLLGAAAIKAAIEHTNILTDDFAARRMDQSIRLALKGHNVDEV